MGFYDHSWDLYYQGYQIEAITRSREGRLEELRVNGVVIKNAKIISYMDWATIHANYSFSNVEREIEIRLATKTGMFDFSKGLQVFIDGEYIGSEKYTLYPDLKETRRKIEKGFWHHFFFDGLINYGLILCVPQFMFLYQVKIEKNPNFLIPYLLMNFFVISGIFAGSCDSWHQTKLIMKNLLRFEQKWR
jgi:hypothetical protein